MTALKPAIELAAAASKPYPNDSAEYRNARIGNKGDTGRSGDGTTVVVIRPAASAPTN